MPTFVRVNLSLLLLSAGALAQPSPLPCNNGYTCPLYTTDTCPVANHGSGPFPLDNAAGSTTSGNTIECDYRAGNGDLFCYYDPTTGDNVDDVYGGCCPATASTSCTAGRRRREGHLKKKIVRPWTVPDDPDNIEDFWQPW